MRLCKPMTTVTISPAILKGATMRAHSEDEDQAEREGLADQLDVVTVILLLLVAVFGLLLVAAQIGMWIGRQ